MGAVSYNFATCHIHIYPEVGKRRGMYIQCVYSQPNINHLGHTHTDEGISQLGHPSKGSLCEGDAGNLLPSPQHPLLAGPAATHLTF